MNLRDAKAQVERERPELAGTAKLEAIKALREQAAAEPGPTETPTAPGDRYCVNCQQLVRPTVHNGWGKVWTFIALLQAVAVVVSIVACVRTTHAGGGIIARLVTWPAAIHPVGVGVVAALAALAVAIGVAARVTDAAQRHGTCPRCKSTISQQA